MEGPTGDDASLVQRLRRGDPRAFEDLVIAHQHRVFGVALRMLGNRAEAEDLAQEVFLRVHRAIGEFRGEAKLSTWLHRIAVTRALNRLDLASEKVARASLPLEPQDEDDSAAPIAALADRGQSPLEALEAKELMRRLADCLGKLPPAWRAVLALRDAESRSYEEIASLLQIALGTVRSRLARARLSLKDCVEGRAS